MSDTPSAKPPGHGDCVSPILFCSDIEATFRVFVEQLGFERKWDWGDPVDFGCVSTGDVDIFLCAEGQGSAGTWLMVFVEDVTAYHEQVVAAGAKIHSALSDYPWGCREFTVSLPDHHVIRFGGEIPCE